MPDTPFEQKFTINSNAHIFSTAYNGLGTEPAYPAGLKIEQEKTVQMIHRHEHDAEAHAKRVLNVGPDGQPYTDGNRLPVDALVDVGDIHIGAVEIKDHDTDTRVSVEECGVYNAMMTKDCLDAQSNTVNVYGEANIPYDTEITLATFNVPVGRKFKFTGMIVGGDADGEFFAKVDGSIVAKVRNSSAVRTITAKFWNEPSSNAGGQVTITCKNVSWVKRNTKEFEATLNGYTIPA